MKVAEQAAGKRVDCPACKKAFRAPQAVAVAPPEKPTEAAGPPPATTPTRVWYFHLDGRNDGPHAAETVVEQVKTGRLDQHALVWKQGMGDWQPIGEVAEFKGAFATPPPVHHPGLHKPHPPKPHGAKPQKPEQEREQRAHYSREKGRRDVMVGIWIAGGLVMVAVIALAVVMSRKPEAPATKPPILPIVEQPPVPYPGTPTTPTPKGTPTPTPPPKKAPKAEASNSALLAAMVADLDRCFKAAIEGHKKASARPILALTQKCKSYAEKLAARDWGPYKDEVEAVMKRLNEAGTGMTNVLRERSQAWGLGEGLDDKKKAEILELNKYEWITNWQKILNDDIERVRKKGMDF